MTNVLIYNRPWHFEQFEHLAREIWPDCDPISVSEHKSADQYGLRGSFYSALKARISSADLSEDEILNVILRCRLLRTLKSHKARSIVLAMNHAIESCLDQINPAGVLSVTIDSYVIHLIYLGCKRRGIPFIGLIPSFVKGYFRIAALGESQSARVVSDSEVNAVCETLLNPDYKPSFLVRTTKDMKKRAVRNWLRNLPKPIWFRARRLATNDPLNCHYLTTQIISQRYWSIWPQSYKGEEIIALGDLKILGSGKPLVFLPLQMSPEATIDYWSTDIDWIDYENYVLDIIDRYKDNCVFLLKEHPNVLGFRSPGFYDRLKSRENCIMIATETASNKVLEVCNATLVCTGTVGFEASMRGVPVYSDNSIWHLPQGTVRPLNTLAELSSESRVDSRNCEGLVRNLLIGLLPGDLVNDGSWQQDNPNDVKRNVEVATSIKAYYLQFLRPY